jgi:hypothetical protein
LINSGTLNPHTLKSVGLGRVVLIVRIEYTKYPTPIFGKVNPMKMKIIGIRIGEKATNLT